ncbi:MAG: maleylpyruvate isomerase family mycothiol-dependent enzyme [Acidimicrobiales bacterium]
MELNPRYEGQAVIRIDFPSDDPAGPVIRQRRRLADILAAFDADQWSAPTRCDGWTAKDVVIHLSGTNAFWAASIAAGRSGKPTRFLRSFDPVTTPAAMVSAASDIGTAELVDQFTTRVEALAALLDDLGDDEWSLPAEAPPGHIAIRAVALHALWDSWIHERDILLLQGVTPVEEPDEVAASLVYAVPLAPSFLATAGSTRTGQLHVSATEPELEFLVDIGTSVVVREGAPAVGCGQLSGRGVDLVETLSFRGPPVQIDPDDQWMLEGLGTVFDVGA